MGTGSFGENARDHVSGEEAFGEGLRGPARTRWSAGGPRAEGRVCSSDGSPDAHSLICWLMSLARRGAAVPGPGCTLENDKPVNSTTGVWRVSAYHAPGAVQPLTCLNSYWFFLFFLSFCVKVNLHRVEPSHWSLRLDACLPV